MLDEIQRAPDLVSYIKCNCGNPIWVIGSAITGNACFSCITGEAVDQRQIFFSGRRINDADQAVPDSDDEIDEACI